MTTPKYSKIGITTAIPDDVDPIGVYESQGGIEVFETDEPYLLSDGKSLVDPMPVRMVEGPIYQDTLGNAQTAIPVRGVTPPVEGITWDNNTPWDDGTLWSL